MYNGIYTIEQYAYVHDTLVKWLSMKLSGESIGGRLKSKGINKIAIYGANEFGQMVYADVKDKVKVEAFIDKKASELLLIDGKNVVLPSEAGTLDKENYILVTPEYYFREIANDLIKAGIRENRVLSIAMVVA